MTVNISLTPQQEEKVRQRVASGDYASVSEVMRAGLRLLEQQEKLRAIQLQELREEVMLGVGQAERGETEVFDEAAVEGIKKRGRKRLAAQKK
ncbi:MAG: type II toxin-antitoxin system ParD family antitoxin [Deltaproteobacteria bacterium]|nr:type II toxin-antitoxin system ParD family antitoxin [Deltaproteobacteria bacterium]